MVYREGLKLGKTEGIAPKLTLGCLLLIKETTRADVEDVK